MNFNANTRKAAYAFLLAVQPLAVSYGLVTQDLSVLWVNAIAATGTAVLALTNITPDKDGKHEA